MDSGGVGGGGVDGGGGRGGDEWVAEAASFCCCWKTFCCCWKRNCRNCWRLRGSVPDGVGRASCWLAPARPGGMLIVAKELVPAGMLEARAVARGGSQPRGEMPNGVDGDADWLGSVRPDGGSGLVRVPGEKAVNWSSGGMAWAAECRGHVDRVSPVIL